MIVGPVWTLEQLVLITTKCIFCILWMNSSDTSSWWGRIRVMRCNNSLMWCCFYSPAESSGNGSLTSNNGSPDNLARTFSTCLQHSKHLFSCLILFRCFIKLEKNTSTLGWKQIASVVLRQAKQIIKIRVTTEFWTQTNKWNLMADAWILLRRKCQIPEDFCNPLMHCKALKNYFQFHGKTKSKAFVF